MTNQSKSKLTRFSWLIVSAVVTAFFALLIANFFKEKTELTINAKHNDLDGNYAVHLYIENIGDRGLSNLRISVEISDDIASMYNGFTIKEGKVFSGDCEFIGLDKSKESAFVYFQSNMINPNEKIHISLTYQKLVGGPVNEISVVARTEGYTHSKSFDFSDSY